jgi:hypothetical protein
MGNFPRTRKLLLGLTDKVADVHTALGDLVTRAKTIKLHDKASPFLNYSIDITTGLWRDWRRSSRTARRRGQDALLRYGREKVGDGNKEPRFVCAMT